MSIQNVTLRLSSFAYECSEAYFPINGGGVGWGEAINGGFGMVLDGTTECDDNILNMLHFDMHNGSARRAWARNRNAVFSVEREMKAKDSFRITLPNEVNADLLESIID